MLPNEADGSHEAPANALRVLHIHSSLTVRSGVMGVLMNYFRHIDRTRVVFDFYTYYHPSDRTYQAEIESLGGRCLEGPDSKNIFTIRRHLATVLKEHEGEYRVVHIHDPMLARFLWPVIHRNGNASVIVHSHSTGYSGSRIRAFRNWLACRNISRYSDARMACSNDAGVHLFGDDGFTVMRNAIEVERFAFDEGTRKSVRAEFGLEGACVIGHVGRFSEEKNHTLLLSVFKEFVQREPTSRLLLVGDGQLRERYEAIASEQGIGDRVIFLGHSGRVSELYQAMDVFVLPSRFEGLGLVGVEAQCAGVPVVCSDRVPREIETLNCSFVALDSPPDVWARKIDSVRLQTDRGRELGAEATRLSGYDVSDAVDEIMRCYEELALTGGR
ncbi:Glycosyltransferase involved in cell wall bisynthesis [Actinomyces ruminicola]|uniref:Glycosyltransferase involved in cell wall bisynthesis n=1 Tax=Actinomyces ruminicola TaxID=332524 RepID=A0A1G9ZEX0_9ACTO|nr:glycosyltransferase [Actinomyces ruminicola]SDN19687.1 Glycosyltransferase involved in cell wall bisynthesis [Actinomyces ruminicola]